MTDVASATPPFRRRRRRLRPQRGLQALADAQQPEMPAEEQDMPEETNTQVSQSPAEQTNGRAAPEQPQAAPAAPMPPQELVEHEEALRAAGLLRVDLPEPEVLKNAEEATKAKLTREEKTKVSLAAAIARAAEIDATYTPSSQGDEFYIDPAVIPAGWRYEYRRDTVLNWRDPAYLVRLAQSGWRAVPRARHPELMPTDWAGTTITRGGMILMEIPEVTFQKRQAEALEIARGEVENKLAQLSGRSPKDRPGAQSRRGSATREFGPILDVSRGETAYRGMPSPALPPR